MTRRFPLPRQPFTRMVLPALALGGFGFALFYSTVLGTERDAASQQLSLPAESPFQHTVSASGIIEANTRNIALYPQVPGKIENIFVQIGQRVKAGEVLMRIDGWEAAARLAAAEARVLDAEVQARDTADQLRRAERQKAGLSISDDTLARRRFAAEAAQAQVKTAQAERDQAKVTLDRHLVRAPVDGRVFKINVAAGEYLALPAPGQTSTPPMVMGNDEPLYVRASIDETDLWRLPEHAKATGALRGNRDVTFALKMVRIEPLVVPKRSLTGDTTERVDTRVLEVIYEIEKSSAPVYIGQQVDVFINAAPRADG